MSGTGADGPGVDAPFRPRRGRVVPLLVAATFLAITVGVGLAMGSRAGWSPFDQAALIAFGCAVSGFIWRYSAIRADPGPDGLTVRNLMLTRTVGWDEIVEVRFVDGDPWVSLELDDSDTVAVMAVQRVDGASGRREAERLARLVAARRGGRPTG